jgi:hypothetical protein
MTRSIVLETETVEKEHKCNWTKLDVARKEDLVNDHFVPADVRMHYDNERAASCCDFRSPSRLSVERSSRSQDIPMYRGDLVDGSPLHLETGHKGLRGSTQDLVYANKSTVSKIVYFACMYAGRQADTAVTIVN